MDNEVKNEKSPAVFISYSHDTPQHKKWVGELASRLVDNRVDVLLDQWEIDLGDDIPKFMERSVSKADCVLMICTETYVRKADDGTGGAGYEAMIVTGELVKDLGTAKFIPVIRQINGTKLVPKSMSTRFFADFSDGQNFDEQFEVLLRRIHKVPKFKKPALGKDPFAAERAAISTASEPKAQPAEIVSQLYLQASRSAQNNDVLSWRRLLRQAKQLGFEQLQAWRATSEKDLQVERGDLLPVAGTGVGAIAPILAVALAGVESGQDKFKNQVGIIDEILAPPGWSNAGYAAIAEFPNCLVLVYQALHGAVCMDTDQAGLAVRLARSQFRRPHSLEKVTLFEERNWVGWLNFISESATVAWDFLGSLYESQLWLKEIFGSKEDYLAALSSYYALLNIMEATAFVVSGRSGLFKGGELHLDVPLCCFTIPRELGPRAYRKLTQDKGELKNVWEGAGISTESLAKVWPAFVECCKRWLWEVYRGRPGRFELYHREIFTELQFSSAKIGAEVG